MYTELFERQDGICTCGCKQPLHELSHLNSIDHYPVRREDKGEYTLDNLRLIRLDCDWALEDNAPNSRYPEIATAYRTYKFFQKERARCTNMIQAFTGAKAGITRSPYFNAEMKDLIEDSLINAKVKEREYFNLLGRLMRAHPIGKVLIQAPGMAAITAAMLLDKVDITKSGSVSALWKFFGFTPEQAAGQKGRNPGLGQLRSAFYAIPWATKNLGKYNEFYRVKRDKELNHGQACQRTIKLWLSHLWDTWRRLEGLSNRSPYIFDKEPGHEYLSPDEFGWPTIE